MSEAVKAVVFNHGKQLDGKYKSIVGMVIVSDRPIQLVNNNEAILMGAKVGTPILDDLEQLTEYKRPYILGDLSSALINIAGMSPKALERAKP